MDQLDILELLLSLRKYPLVEVMIRTFFLIYKQHFDEGIETSVIFQQLTELNLAISPKFWNAFIEKLILKNWNKLQFRLESIMLQYKM